MPIYEYRCDSCAHEFETIQKVSEPPLTTCPACSAEALRKKVSAAGFRLKGGGWYETDFKSGTRKNVAGEDKTSKSADDGGGTKSADGKKATDKAGSDKGSKADSSKSSSDAKGSASKAKASD